MVRTHTCDRCDAPCSEPEDEFGEFLCSDCEQNIAERGWERFCSDFYGGDQPFTLREQLEAARKLK